MAKVYYKDSFAIRVRLKDCRGAVVIPTDCNWRGRLYTPDSICDVIIGYNRPESDVRNAIDNVVEGSWGWKLADDAESIIIPVDNHNLKPGPLMLDMVYFLPSDTMQDSKQEVHKSYGLGLELVRQQQQCIPDAADAELLLPYIKGDQGDPLTWADLTTAQIEELQRPAQEAAAIVHDDFERQKAEADRRLDELVAEVQSDIGNLYSGARNRIIKLTDICRQASVALDFGETSVIGQTHNFINEMELASVEAINVATVSIDGEEAVEPSACVGKVWQLGATLTAEIQRQAEGKPAWMFLNFVFLPKRNTDNTDNTETTDI